MAALCAALLLCALCPDRELCAQDLPALARDNAVSSGTLPNGIRYYLVQNAAGFGVSDIALVRRNATDFPKDFRMDSVWRFKGDFPSRNRLAPGPDGHVSREGDALVISLRNVPMAHNPALADSVLLYMMALVERTSDERNSADNVIIMAGDFNVADVTAKLNTLSMMVPAGKSAGNGEAYAWQESPGRNYVTGRSRDGRACARLEFRAPRLPAKSMETAIPVVAEEMALELGELMKSRLEAALKRAGVRYSDIRSVFRSSADGPSDEIHSIEIVTTDEDLLKVACVLAAEVDHASSGDFSLEEYSSVMSALTAGFERNMQLNPGRTNEEWVRLCISACLYGAGIPTGSECVSLVSRRQVEPARKLESFNSYAGAVMTMDHDLKLSCLFAGQPAFDHSVLKEAVDACIPEVDVLPEVKPFSVDSLPGEGLKSKSSMKSEPLSGGTLLTYPGGLRVIYRKMNTGGLLHYRFTLPGGTAMLKLPENVTSDMVSEIFSSMGMLGMSATRADRFFMANGLQMKREITPSAIRISGTSGGKDLALVARALSAVANESDSLDAEDVRYRLGGRHAVDVAPEFIRELDSWLHQRFLACGSALLVLAGEMEPLDVQKELNLYMSRFHYPATRLKETAVKAAGPPLEIAVRTVPGARAAAMIEAEVSCPATLDNLFAGIACRMALEDEIAELSPLYARADSRLDLGGDRLRLSVYVTGEQNALTGEEMAAVAGQAMERLAKGSVDGKRMEIYKARIGKMLASLQARPEYWLEAITLRYLDGKDFSTTAAERVKALAPAAVSGIFSEIKPASRAETYYKPAK
ncbi:MAG: hypothetical protein HUJ94_05265 [Bacteroidales bacterium]|nr:hypothetical protein [Bacteroidales bacterium]